MALVIHILRQPWKENSTEDMATNFQTGQTGPDLRLGEEAGALEAVYSAHEDT